MNQTRTIDTWVTSVVIIDDDFVSAVCLEALLRQEGYTPFKASNGPDGRQLVRTQQPELVLLDIQMPGEDGIETCRRLKEDPATADVPVIFLSGAEDLSTKLEGFNVGAVDYITKPYQTAEVLARIQVHIRARRMMKLLAATQIAQLDRLGRALEAILPDPGLMPEARFAAFYKPFHAVGGDFYEVLQAGDQIFDYVVADVSGHDPEASLVTSALKVLLNQGQCTLSTPLETLRMINASLRSTFPEHVYLTLAWVRLNRHRMTLTTYLAGHPPVLCLGSRASGTEFINNPGDVLGVFDTVEFEETQRAVEKGDRILLFTDGLIELPFEEGASSRGGGLEKLAQAAEKHRALPLADMVQRMAEELVQQSRGVSDDLLLLGLEV